MPAKKLIVNRDPLRNTHVHIGGMGRIGTNIALALHEAGVGTISANDPQTFEREQLKVCGFSRESDLGRAKVHVLDRYFDGRPGFTFIPIVAPNHCDAVFPYLKAADVIVSSANNLPARLHLERAAVQLGKPSIQACVQDAREALGGVITRWAPKSRGACFGCLFQNPKQGFRRSEILLPVVVKTIASLAAHLVTETLLCRGEKKELGNILVVDMARTTMERLSVKAVAGCPVCGR